MFPFPVDVITQLLKLGGDAASNTIFDQLFAWMARGLAFVIEYVWRTLDTSTSPKLTEPWFQGDVMKPLLLLGAGTTAALILATAIHGAWSGKPEMTLDGVRHGAWSIVASALCVTVTATLLNLADGIGDQIWAIARDDSQHLLEGILKTLEGSAELNMGFVGVLIVLLMILAILGLAIVLQVRMALLYIAVGLAPLIFASSVFPMLRASSRKLIHLMVALVFSKLAIVIALTISVKLMAHATDTTSTGNAITDGTNSIGVLLAGVICFAIASMTPMVLYKLLPTVEGAMVGAGIASGWGRAGMTAMYGANSARSMTQSLTSRLATQQAPGQSDSRPPPPSSPGGSSPSTGSATTTSASTGTAGTAGAGGAGAGGAAAAGGTAGASAAGGAAAGGAAAGGAAAAGPAAVVVAPAALGLGALAKFKDVVANQSSSATNPGGDRS